MDEVKKGTTAVRDPAKTALDAAGATAYTLYSVLDTARGLYAAGDIKGALGRFSGRDARSVTFLLDTLVNQVEAAVKAINVPNPAVEEAKALFKKFATVPPDVLLQALAAITPEEVAALTPSMFSQIFALDVQLKKAS